jgi:hypothetical protein
LSPARSLNHMRDLSTAPACKAPQFAVNVERPVRTLLVRTRIDFHGQITMLILFSVV